MNHLKLNYWSNGCYWRADTHVYCCSGQKTVEEKVSPLLQQSDASTLTLYSGKARLWHMLLKVGDCKRWMDSHDTGILWTLKYKTCFFLFLFSTRSIVCLKMSFLVMRSLEESQTLYATAARASGAPLMQSDRFLTDIIALPLTFLSLPVWIHNSWLNPQELHTTEDKNCWQLVLCLFDLLPNTIFFWQWNMCSVMKSV